MAQNKVKVKGISCGHCAATIEKELGTIVGIDLAQVDVETKTVTVVHQDTVVWSDIENLLDEIGYPVEK